MILLSSIKWVYEYSRSCVHVWYTSKRENVNCILIWPSAALFTKEPNVNRKCKWKNLNHEIIFFFFCILQIDLFHFIGHATVTFLTNCFKIQQWIICSWYTFSLHRSSASPKTVSIAIWMRLRKLKQTRAYSILIIRPHSMNTKCSKRWKTSWRAKRFKSLPTITKKIHCEYAIATISCRIYTWYIYAHCTYPKVFLTHFPPILCHLTDVLNNK